MPKVEKIICNFCNLMYLPKTFPNCISLSIDDNNLEELPYLPKCKHLSCSNNLLKKIPIIPDCMTQLWCHNNEHLHYDIIIANRFDLPYPPLNINIKKISDINYKLFLPYSHRCERSIKFNILLILNLFYFNIGIKLVNNLNY